MVLCSASSILVVSSGLGNLVWLVCFMASPLEDGAGNIEAVKL